MVLFHHVVKILGLADFDRGAVLFIVALDGRFIGRTSVDGDRLGHPMAADRLGQEAFRGLLIALLRQQKVNRLAMLIHGAIEIAPLACHADVGLVHAPAAPHGALAAVKGLCQWGAVFDHPALDRRAVGGDPAFFQALFHLAIAQGIRHIPSPACEDHLRWEMGPLETHRHRLSPPLFTLSHRGRSYLKSPRMKTCDRTLFDPERLSTVFALGMGGDKGRGLLFHETLLERGEDLLRFREGQAEVLNALAGLLQDTTLVKVASWPSSSHTTNWTVIFMGAVLQSG